MRKAKYLKVANRINLYFCVPGYMLEKYFNGKRVTVRVVNSIDDFRRLAKKL